MTAPVSASPAAENSPVAEPLPAVPPAAAPVPWDVQVFFDGACPLCRREIAWLRSLDRRRRIEFTDLAAADFDPAAWGRDLDTLMARIHGRLPDGTWIEGVEVFRRLYAAVGFGPLVFVTRLPGISQLLDWGYGVFAARRLRLTGRCDDGACRVPQANSQSAPAPSDADTPQPGGQASGRPPRM